MKVGPLLYFYFTSRCFSRFYDAYRLVLSKVERFVCFWKCKDLNLFEFKYIFLILANFV